MRNRIVVVIIAFITSIPKVFGAGGDLDTTFNSTGIVTTQIGVGLGSNDHARAVAIQNDGKIVVGGYTSNASDYDFAIVRYYPNGSLDESFGTSGIATTPFGTGWVEAEEITIQPDGKILLAGSVDNGASIDFAIVRYNNDGTLDSGFGSGGIVITNIQYSDFMRGLVLQPDGKIVIVGRLHNYANNHSSILIVRYNNNGTIDTSFAGNGWVNITLDNYEDSPDDITIQPDGKLIVVGNYNDSTTDRNIVFALRYLSDGTLDSTFDFDGIVTIPIGLGATYANSVKIQSDGKIVIGGSAGTTFGEDFTVIRLLSDGTLDTDFNSSGIVTTPMCTDADIGYSVSLQSNGKIVLGGRSWNGETTDFALAQYNPDGSLDDGFNSDGRVITGIGNNTSGAFDVAIQPNSKIILVGTNYSGETGADFAVVRYIGDSDPPAVPLNLAAVAGFRQVTLQWSANTEPDLIKYRIYRDQSSFPTTLIDSLSGFPPDTSYLDSNLTNGQTYFYRVTAIDSSGNESGYSNGVSATPNYTGPIWHVSTSGSDENDGSEDSPLYNIQQGINMSQNGDTVLVYPGTYVENINFNGKNIVVGSLFLTTQDTSYISSTIIDGNQSGSVVIFENGEDSNALLSGFFITKSYDRELIIENSNPTITHCVISGNPASQGASRGIWCDNSSPTLDRIVVANHNGIGIFLQNNSLPTITNSSIKNNGGSGISCNNQSAPLIENVIIIDNNDPADGGGLFSDHSSPILNNVTISGNSAGSNGGGLYSSYSQVTLSFVKISNNSSAIGGGGIIAFQGSQLSVNNCEITGNVTSNYNGGGIYIDQGCTLNMMNSTVSDNSSDANGSGLYMSGYYLVNSGASITNSIFWNNSIFLELFSHIDIHYTDISGGAEAIGGVLDHLSYDNIINEDPLFVLPSEGNYYLSENSPCIDAGDPAGQDPDGTTSDLGAYFFDQTNIDTYPPTNPQNLSASAGNQQSTLNWDANTETDLAKYRIYRNTSSPATTLVDSVVGSPPLVQYTDYGLTNGQISYYRITAVDTSGNESEYSNEVYSIPNPQLYLVKTDGTGDFTVIQSAIDASINGDTILVSEGEYFENIVIEKKSVVLAAVLDDSVIINGNALSNVILIDTCQTVVIEGFHIKNGLAETVPYNLGGGILTIYSGVSIINCIIESCTSENGGGFAAKYSSINMTDCTVLNNSSEWAGGGIFIASGSCQLSNCKIDNNIVTGTWGGMNGGGGVFAFNSDIAIDSCQVSNNTENQMCGGGFYIRGAMSQTSFAISNSIFFGNTSKGLGGAIYADSDLDGPGIITNTICWNDTVLDGNDSEINSWGNLSVSFSIIDGGYLYPGEGVLTSDPLFCNAENGDFTVASNSPALASGDGGSNIGGIEIGCQPPYSGPVWHILTAGFDGSGDGSETNPFATIQHGINQSQNGDTVLVYPGTYVENINFNGKNIVVGSLFMTTQDTSYISSTIIDGDQNGSVVTFESGEDNSAVISGFIINNGFSSHGGGIHLIGSSPKITNCTISNNYVTNDGAGIYCLDQSSPNIINCKIVFNSADQVGGNGGGIKCANYSSPTITNTEISNNVADQNGGGILLTNDCSPHLINISLINNSASQGGGLWVGYSDVFLTNSIIWGNLSGSIHQNVGNITITYSDIEGGFIGTGNIDLDPLFIDATYNDFRLSDNSPCIGAGADSFQIDGIWYFAPITDIDGNPRPNPPGSNPDIGVYENILSEPILPIADSMLFISEMIEGDYNNKALELFNNSDSIVDLDNYAFFVCNNGCLEVDWEYWWPFPEGLFVEPHTTFTIVYQLAGPELLSLANLVLAYPSMVTFNGNDYHALVEIIGGDTLIIDVIGEPGEAPDNGSGWSVAGVPDATLNHTLIRKSWVSQGTTDWSISAGTNFDDSEWFVMPLNYFGNFGEHGTFLVYDGPVWHVDTTGIDDYLNGASDSPLRSIQYAIDRAVDGDTVLVHPGTYVENINFNGHNIVVGSLFLTTQDTSFISSTIIDGNQGGSVVTFNSFEDTTAVIKGFTIVNGLASEYSNNRGGGIYCVQSGPKISNVIIQNNTADLGGGIGIDTIYVDNYKTPVIENSIIRENTANFGGGIYCFECGRPVVENSLIVENTANSDGGGIYLNGSAQNQMIFVNVTISNNTSSSGGGISSNGDSVMVMSSILWDNYPNELEGPQIFSKNCDIMGGWTGTGNIDVNPDFVNPTLGNYRLSNYSPCIGTGIISADFFGYLFDALFYDIENNPRPNPVGSNPDIGAFENPLPSQLPLAQSIRDGLGDDTDWTNSSSALSANWDPFIDDSTVTFECAVGTAMDTISNILDWTLAGTDTFTTLSDLTLISGTTYYVSVRGTDMDGQQSDTATTDGVMIDLINPLIGEIWEGSDTADVDWQNSTTDILVAWQGSDSRIIANYRVSLGFSPGNTDVASWQDNGTSTTVTFSGLSLTEGNTIYANIQAKDEAGNYSTVNSGDGITIDLTSPTIGVVIDGLNEDLVYTGQGDSLKVHWLSGQDNLSGIDHYEYALGTTPGGSDILAWMDCNLDTAAKAYGLGLNNGVTYYCSVKAQDRALNVSEMSTSNGITVDLEPPITGIVHDDADWTNDTETMSFYWSGFSDPVSGIQLYEYSVGTSLGADDHLPWASVSLDTFVIETGLVLEEGTTYYGNVRAIDSVNHVSDVVSTNGVTIDLTSPIVEFVYEGSISEDLDFTGASDSLMISWNSIDDASGIIGNSVSLGTSPGDSDVVDWMNADSVASIYVFNGLTLNEGVPYYCNVRATDVAGNISLISSGDGIIPDFSPPNLGFVNDGDSTDIEYSESDTSYQGNWGAFNDDLSGLSHYIYGFDPGTGIISDTTVDSSISFINLTLNQGTAYALSVSAVDQVNNQSDWVTSDSVIIDKYAGPPTVLSATPGNSSILSMSGINTISISLSEPLGGYLLEFDSHSDPINSDINYSDSPPTLTVTISNQLIYADTVTVYLNNYHDLAGLQGDSVVFTFFTPWLCDFNNDWKIDVQDIADFAGHWNTNTLTNLGTGTSYEFGPVTGDPPLFHLDPDSIFNIRDVMGFTRMWNWSHRTGVTTLVFNPVGDPIEFEQNGRFLNVMVPEDAQAGQIQIHYPNQSIEMDYADEESSPNRISLKSGNKELGQLLIEYADLNANPRPKLSLGTKPLTRENTTITIGYAFYSLDHQLLREGISTIELVAVPDQYALHQNYPNPFNPITRIEYDTPENTLVNITIYDILGREVRTLVDDDIKAGYHSVQWNGRTDSGALAGTGMYFYRISAGDFHSVKKMVLLK